METLHSSLTQRIILSSADRALLLGHTVQVNESHYSVSDKRRLDKIKETLQKREVI